MVVIDRQVTPTTLPVTANIAAWWCHLGEQLYTVVKQLTDLAGEQKNALYCLLQVEGYYRALKIVIHSLNSSGLLL